MHEANKKKGEIDLTKEAKTTISPFSVQFI